MNKRGPQPQLLIIDAMCAFQYCIRRDATVNLAIGSKIGQLFEGERVFNIIARLDAGRGVLRPIGELFVYNEEECPCLCRSRQVQVRDGKRL